MKQRLVLLSLLLAGCASGPPVYPPIDETGSESTRIEPDIVSPASNPAPLPPSVDADANPVVTAQRVEEIQRESPAIVYLLDQAEQALLAKDYVTAGSLADRALRLDRTAARAYLVGAQVLFEQGHIQMGLNLAKQGVLYSSEDSRDGRFLRQLVRYYGD